jgi:beta-lactamase class A
MAGLFGTVGIAHLHIAAGPAGGHRNALQMGSVRGPKIHRMNSTSASSGIGLCCLQLGAMNKSRRTLLNSIAAGAATLATNSSFAKGNGPDHRGSPDYNGLAQEIQDLFRDLPDRKALKVWAPPTGDGPEFSVQLHENRKMFTASTNKSFMLCERLRQLDSPTLTAQIETHEVPINKDIYSPGSPVFNPPDLSGLVSERTAMEAMILHSDNTGTDIVLKEAGVANVRKFIASIGLKNTMIPDSTRILAAYLLGAPNYMTITWDELVSIPPGPLAHPFLNDMETLASSAADLVSFFSRALEGRFFAHRQTLEEFRRILSIGDINYLVRFPLGISAFGKAGYADVSGSHARSIAGGLYFPKRWVYFSFVLNWEAEELDDATTVEAFYTAIRQTARLLRERLGA